MTGEDFLQLANRLCLEADEASQRTAISRAYYGVFHIARRLVIGCGVDLPRHNEQEHTRIPQCLINSQHEVAQEAGRRLKELRLDRNEADYAFENRLIADRHKIDDCMDNARSIQKLLTECDTGPDREFIRNGVRHYARLVLKWPLR